MFKSSPHILVVEDDPVTADMLRELLAGAGYEVQWAPDVIAALSVLQSQPIDLITLDMELGTYSGRSLLALLKTDRHTCQIPVIVISSSQVGDGVRRLAQHVLSKPFNITPLIQAIGSTLRRQSRGTDAWHENTPDSNLGLELEVAREVLD